MGNPFNPLDWLKSAQDWFSRTERSSGFRPFLIYLILIFGLAITLFILFPENQFIISTFVYLILGSCFLFIILYFIKSIQQPDFCRSESHVQKVLKIEMERMGTESKQVEAAEVEEVELIEDTSIKQIGEASDKEVGK
ncbi:MAG TPA: hypothetical protein PLZ15_09820 [Melioribacteraceae bacterium]|nr:hypothetical protein [Melioribacteraceae bacterium]